MITVKKYLKSLFFYTLLSLFVPLCVFITGAHAIDISQTPVEVMLQPNPPNFMIALDNSGSMGYETITQGVQQGYFELKTDDPNSYYKNLSINQVQQLDLRGTYKSIKIKIGNKWVEVQYLIPGRTEIAPYWRSRWAGWHKKTATTSDIASDYAENSSNDNGMYYSPFTKYTAWKQFAVTTGISSLMDQAAIPPNETRFHPTKTTAYTKSIKLTDSCTGYSPDEVEKYINKQYIYVSDKFATLHGVELRRAHYFVWSESSGGNAYLVNFEGNTRKYYKVDDDKDGIIESGEITQVDALPSDITSDSDWIGDDAKDLQNFANWFTYYRTRWNTTIGACTRMLDLFDNVNIGVYSINEGARNKVVKHRVLNTTDMKIYSDIKTIGDKLINETPGGGTPLRTALDTVGTYYKSGITVGSSNWASPLSGACQQNFAMVFTDGYWNDDPDFVSLPEANPDKESPQGATDIYSGAGVGACPYKDDYSYTLADVAMYYYKKDLSPAANNVPPNGADANPQQHMVTYTVGFGLKGASMGDFNSSSCPWPKPVANTETTINDLDHAAKNGRGLYISAKNPTELDQAFSRVVSDIQSRAGSAASVSVNGEQISDNLRFYQSIYDPAIWHGDVKSKKLDTNGNPTLPGWIGPGGKEVTASDMLNILDNTPDVLPGYDVNSDTVYNLRKIITYNGTTGIPFRSNAALTATQKKQLVPSATQPEPAGYNPDPAKVTDIINFLRGDHRKEKRNGGTYRNRGKIDSYTDSDGNTQSILYNYKLGDIVHSTPVYYNSISESDDSGGVLYAGANDGMLHAFSVQTGQEIFAYIPNLVFSKLWMLSAPLYDNAHQYYVDLSPFAKKISSGRSLLVGGLGGGGKGIYCLDITNAAGTIEDESAAASMIKWEYPTGTDDDMGFSYSKPVIVNTKAGWKVIFGNGYNSKNGKAVLYVAGIDGNGALGTVTKIDTLSGGRINLNSGTGANQDSDTDDLGESNGLSSPTVIDANGDGFCDYVYAGDLFGNMWKFNIKDSDVAKWKVSYGTATAPMPLFRAKNGSGTTAGADSMPITSRPDVMFHCMGGYPGYMVVFGTGIYLGGSDMTNKAIQGIFGVWDYGDDEDSTEYVGTFNIATNSFVSKSPDLPSGISMLCQEIKPYTIQSEEDTTGKKTVSVTVRVFTDYEPNWTLKDDADANQKKNPSVNVGWFFPMKYNDLGQSTPIGERVINDVLIRNGAAIVTSLIPDLSSACSVGGNSWFYEINACTGGRLDQSHIDANDDNYIDKYDLVEIPVDPNNPNGPKKKVSIAGVRYGNLIYPPTIVRQNDSSSETKFMSTSAGTIVKIVEAAEKRGIFYWRTY